MSNAQNFQNYIRGYGLEYITEATIADTDANLEISLGRSDYNFIYFVGYFRNNTDNTSITIDISDDDGVSYVSTPFDRFDIRATESGGTGSTSGNYTANSNPIAISVGNDDNGLHDVHVECLIFNAGTQIADVGMTKMCFINEWQGQTAGNDVRIRHAALRGHSSSDINMNAFKLTPGSGTFGRGYIRVFGVR